MRLVRFIVFLGLLMVMTLSLPSAALFARQLPTTAAPPGMVPISGGTFRPLYDNGGEPEAVSAFYMDVSPVTNGQFLAFVKANPRWQRSNISPLFGESSYLIKWKGDTDLGDLGVNQPVTHVSWFAAKAYAKWVGNRLPTTAEWEMVAGAGKFIPDGRLDPSFKKELLRLTNQPTPDPLPDVGHAEPNYWGVQNLHGLLWEWVSDFNSAMVTGESRADSSLERKLFCGSGVVGASDFTDYAAFMRFAFRGSVTATYAGSNLGFRTVRSY